MARPQKQTVDYFPHDAVGGKTLFILQNRFGNNGYAVWFKLLALLCRTPGHVYYCSKPNDWQFFVAEMALSVAETLAIVDCLAELEAIDPQLWKEKIIWSQNLVNRLASVYRERKTPIPVKPTINAVSPPTNLVSPTDNSENNNIAGVSPPDNTQSKVKETKEKKSMCIPPISIPEKGNHKTPFGEFSNVFLTERELEKLKVRFGEVEALQKVESLSEGIQSKGYKYQSHYATILAWARSELYKNGGKQDEL